MRPVIAALLATTVFGAGCASHPCDGVAGSCLDLTVASTTALTVSTLHVSASGAFSGSMDSTRGSVALPVEIPILFPSTAAGQITLSIAAFDSSQGHELADGSTTITLAAGAHLRESLTLMAFTPSVDGGPPLEDLAHAADLAHADLAQPTTDMGVPLATACSDYAHASCSRLDACDTITPTFMQRDWGDEATCEARLTLTCTTEGGAPGTGVTPAMREKCAQAYAAQSCSDRFAGFLPSACLSVGASGNGTPCVFDSQCQSGFCHLQSGVSCGVCAATTIAGSSTCASNSDCSGQEACAGGVCQTLVPLNGVCGSNNPCAEELSCTGGHCENQGASSGIACDASGSTAPTCDNDRGLYCGSSKCAALGSSNPGSVCGNSGSVHSTCVEGSDCFNGSCVAKAADNAACDSTNGPGCRSPARCISGNCRLPATSTCH